MGKIPFQPSPQEIISDVKFSSAGGKKEDWEQPT
jgi:hypothetical protein